MCKVKTSWASERRARFSRQDRKAGYRYEFKSIVRYAGLSLAMFVVRCVESLSELGGRVFDATKKIWRQIGTGSKSKIVLLVRKAKTWPADKRNDKTVRRRARPQPKIVV